METKTNPPQPSVRPVIPAEGWHVLHLFYSINFEKWRSITGRSGTVKEAMRKVADWKSGGGDLQLLTFAMVTPKADIGFMILGPDLQKLNAVEKQINQLLGPGVLVPTYNYLSVTERSEYTTSEEDYRKQLVEEGTPEHEIEGKLEDFRARMDKYGKNRLYPNLPDWPVFCFYPMLKRRVGEDNWYSLPFEERKRLMGGHARVGRQWAGKILQLITGSTGLDEYEWGVTLFAHDTKDIQGVVYEMRFDEVSARYAEFGPFYIGLQMPVEEIFARLSL